MNFNNIIIFSLLYSLLGLFTVGIFGSFSTHFSIIFCFILLPFFLKNKTENEIKMKVKWNPNLDFAKMMWKMVIFHLFGSVPDE